MVKATNKILQKQYTKRGAPVTGCHPTGAIQEQWENSFDILM